MNTREIEVLLEKYYEGNTSLSEEKLLRDFFGGKEVPAHLKSHQSLFVFFASERRQEIGNTDFGQKVTGRLSVMPAERQLTPKLTNRNRFLFVTGIAATVLVLISIFYAYNHDGFKNDRVRNNPAATELAYAQASEALLIVSSNLNNGLKEATRLQMIDKAMKNMQLLNKFYQYQTIFINPDDYSNRSIK